MQANPPAAKHLVSAQFSFYLLMAVLIWTGNTLVTKAAGGVIDPAAITFYRWLLAGMVMTSFLGDALMVLAVASNALYGVLLKRWAVPLSTWQQLYVQIGFGVLLLLPLWWLAPSSPVTAHNLPLIVYAGIAASIGAPFFWMSGIKRLGPARASLFMNLLPLFVALAASTLLGEPLHAYHAVGGLLALAGVWWGQRL